MHGNFEKEKELAAVEAIKYIQDGMTIGVGSGSTITYFIKHLGEKVRNGLNIVAVSTSDITAELCEQEGIPLITTFIPAVIDITVDGADEFDQELRLIKGGGGRLLHEKIVASATRKEIIIVDSSKKVEILGEKFSIPIEVVPFAWIKVYREIKKYGGNPRLRLKENNSYFITEEGNYILDCKFDYIANVEELALKLSNISGVVEHGLFIDLASEVIMGKEDKAYYFRAKDNNISKVVTERIQVSTINKIFEKIEGVKLSGAKPVVEMDIDLTTFKPINRTINALKITGEKYGINEFINYEGRFDLLPGYSREAWRDFMSRNKLPEKYPELKWLGDKDATGMEASVYSTFFNEYWITEGLTEDILTEGLILFVSELEKRGAIPVYISGRWIEEQFEPTRQVLINGGIENPILLIGIPPHEGEQNIGDAEIKALRQKEIREKYGTPIAVIDDRLENRNAVCKANEGISMLSIGISIPGFTYDQEITSVPLKISNFIF